MSGGSLRRRATSRTCQIVALHAQELEHGERDVMVSGVVREPCAGAGQRRRDLIRTTRAPNLSQELVSADALASHVGHIPHDIDGETRSRRAVSPPLPSVEQPRRGDA
jgi:hypothetical protein